jgi:hypothetical protein
MRYALLLTVLVALFVAMGTLPAHATLALGDTFPGSPFMMNAGTTSSTFTISVTDPDPASSVPSENIVGFQVRLRIVPDTVTPPTGTLTFASGTQPSSDDLYPGANQFSATFAMSNTELFVNDVQNPYTGGVNVDTVGDNLFDLTLMASNDAAGLFNIVAVRGLVNTSWSDNNADGSMAREFLNVQFAGMGDVVIGQVEVMAAVVPEAGAFAAVGLVAAAVGAWRLVKRLFSPLV